MDVGVADENRLMMKLSTEAVNAALGNHVSWSTAQQRCAVAAADKAYDTKGFVAASCVSKVPRSSYGEGTHAQHCRIHPASI